MATSLPSLTLRRPTADLTLSDQERPSSIHLTGDEHGELLASHDSDAAPSTSTWTPRRPPSSHFISHAELTDLRAIQRTFDGAYARTALGQLSYSIVILRLFEPSFYYVGLAYTILALLLVLISAYRYGLAVSNSDRWADVQLKVFRRQPKDETLTGGGGDGRAKNGKATGRTANETPREGQFETGPSSTATAKPSQLVPPTSNLQRTPSTSSTHSESVQTTTVVKPTFRTAGDVVALATIVLLGVQVALIVLVLRT